MTVCSSLRVTGGAPIGVPLRIEDRSKRCARLRMLEHGVDNIRRAGENGATVVLDEMQRFERIEVLMQYDVPSMGPGAYKEVHATHAPE